MQSIRHIKKYPNRRLYDTTASCYITLEEVRDLVLSHTRIQVTDAKTGEDLTNQILLQVISSQESGHAPFLTTEILQGIIRLHNNPFQQSMQDFLEKAFSFFSEHQENFAETFKNFSATNTPFGQLSQLAQKNMDFWQSFFQQPGTDKNKK